MTSFSNSILHTEEIPVLQKKEFNALDKAYLKLLYLQLCIFFGLLIGGFTLFVILLNRDLPGYIFILSALLILILLIYSVLITRLGFPRKGYLLREKDISYQQGLLACKQTTIPFNRIQHVEVSQGFLSKLFRLSSLNIYTAGGNASDISIPGIPGQTAQNLKDFLSEKISEHE